MYRLAACCLLVLGCLRPLLSLPAPHSGAGPLRLSAADGGGSPRGELDSASLSLLHGLLGTSGAEAAEGLRRAAPGTCRLSWHSGIFFRTDFYLGEGALCGFYPGTNVYNPRGNTRRLQASSGPGPGVSLNRLLARIREQRGKRGHPSECFWKYCV
ncbi:urotensin-2 [Eptesicus fuscus]|uniref:urotensin-2 n=1 Tax=Eptesicus fuscus TaxID=29078 RepID=UPI002403BE62|nr:urotensin-2 [Eptesicus fuscus]